MDVKRLFIPGPVDVSPDVAAKLAEPMIGHREKRLTALLESTVEKLKRLMYTDNTVFVSTSSSTGLMEAAVRNCVKKRCLNVVNGAFSSRWHDITLANGKAADKLDVSWGSAATPEKVDEALSAGEYDTLTVTHNETSTAAMTPLEGISEVAQKHNVMFLVDCVSSLAGVKIEVDKLEIDVALAGTQKALALPPGMAVCSVSEAAFKRSKEVENRGYYFDFQVFLKYLNKGQTPTTVAIPQLNALNYQLGKILDEEGLNARFARHTKMAEHTREWMKKHYELFTEEWCSSNTVSCAKNTRGDDLADLGAKLFERGYLFSNGYGKLKGDAFRVAHMGDRTLEELKEYLELIEELLGL